MIRTLLTGAILLSVTEAHAQDPEIAVLRPPSEEQGAGALIWAGIDYGLVTMYGTEDFRDPGTIFPGYLDKWNDLFEVEQIEVLAKVLRTEITVSTSHLDALHAAAQADLQIVRDNNHGTAIAGVTPEAAAARVGDYVFPEDLSGVAVVLVADLLDKPTATGCYWVTRFDVASRQVHGTDRLCGAARGFGFRNYWFGTVKDVVKQMRSLQ